MSTGPELDTAVGDTVVVTVPSDGPYGVILEADADGNAAVVKAWERLPNGKFGLLQKHGGIHYGDILYGVNDILLDTIPHNEALNIILDRNILKKTFKFISLNEYLKLKRRISSLATSNNNSSTIDNNKNNFLSIIKRSRVNDNNGKKYAEYEIACQWRVITMKLQKEIVYKWSIWKRYSDFDLLHNNLVQSLGWQMNGIDIAPSHTFVFNKLSAEFIDQRKEDLNIYWQKIIRIDKICEFNKHHCSHFIKEFIDVDNIIKNKDNIAVNASSGKDNTDNGIAESDEISNHTSNNKAAKRLSSNNKSLSRRSIAKGGSNSSSNNNNNSNNNSNNTNTNTNTSNNVVQSQSQPQPQAQSNDNTTKKDERFAPYAKMLQIGTPEMAVRLKMGMSGFSESEIDMFFSGSGSSSSGSSGSSGSSSTKIKPPPPPSSSSSSTTAPPPPQPKQNNNNNNTNSSINPPPAAPPKPTGQRANLLASISALRKD